MSIVKPALQRPYSSLEVQPVSPRLRNEAVTNEPRIADPKLGSQCQLKNRATHALKRWWQLCISI
jgi:hypothetical protein